jgi:hypothetical protein
MKTKPGPGFVAFLATLAVMTATALPMLAYQYPLSSTDIRNAYLTGTRKDWVTDDFLSKYSHALPAPATGPHVAEISIDTPYSQIVRLGQTAQNPDSQQAVQDFAKQDLPFIVRVEVDETPTYPNPPVVNPTIGILPLPNFEKDFKIQLTQQGKAIDAVSTQVSLLYSDEASNTPDIYGAVIELRYDNQEIDPFGDVKVKVRTVDGQNVKSTFSLAAMK